MPDGAIGYLEYPPQAGKGQRVDFCFLSARFANRVRVVRVLPDAVGSDHLPVILEIDS